MLSDDELLKTKLFIQENECVPMDSGVILKTAIRGRTNKVSQHSPLAQRMLSCNMIKSLHGAGLCMQKHENSPSPKNETLSTFEKYASDASLPEPHRKIENTDPRSGTDGIEDEHPREHTQTESKSSLREAGLETTDTESIPDIENFKKRDHCIIQIKFGDEKSAENQACEMAQDRVKARRKRGLGAGEGRVTGLRSKGTWWLTKPTACLLVLQCIFVILFTLFMSYSQPLDGYDPNNNVHPILEGRNFEDLPFQYKSHSKAHTHLPLALVLSVVLRAGTRADQLPWTAAVWLLALQWTLLCRGHFAFAKLGGIALGAVELLQAEVLCTGVLIADAASCCCLNALQRMVLVIVVVPLTVTAEFLNNDVIMAVDRGKAMSLHWFPAIFIIATLLSTKIFKACLRGASCGKSARPSLKSLKIQQIQYALPEKSKPDNDTANSKNKFSQGNLNPSKHLNFSALQHFVGSLLFAWSWPCVSALNSTGPARLRVALNSSLALAGGGVVALSATQPFAVTASQRVRAVGDTLVAVTVAVACVAEMPLTPAGALGLGCAAGALSACILGALHLKIYDSERRESRCDGLSRAGTSIAASHAVGGFLGGLASAAVAVALSPPAGHFWHRLYELYPARAPEANSDEVLEVQKYLMIEPGLCRTAVTQALCQLLALLSAAFLALAAGTVTGILLQLPVFLDEENCQRKKNSGHRRCPPHADT